MAYNCPHCKESITDAISKGELTNKVAKHNTLTSALEKQISEMESTARKADRSHKAALQQLREEMSTGHTSALAMARLGLDEDAAAVAELLHNRLPAEDRPGLVDWLESQKSEPDTSHPLLKSYFSKERGPAETATESTQEVSSNGQQASRTSTLPAPSGRPPAGSVQWTPEQINNMTDSEFLANIGALSQAAGFDVAGTLGINGANS